MQLTLVLGGTGKTGRRVVERLTARGLPARVGSRSGEPPFDWEEEATWAPVVQGVDAVYLAYAPDLAFPGAAETIRAFSTLAVSSGVRRIVLVSGRGEEAAEASERMVQNSGADWTILRCNWFSQNFSESFMLEWVRNGKIILPAGDVPEPFIDADDIADVAVAALTEDGHAGQIYILSGPRSLSFADVALEISKAANRDVCYAPGTAEQFNAWLQENGLPVEFTELVATVLDGRNSSPTDGVQRALGREPRDFSDYARETAATGAWAE